MHGRSVEEAVLKPALEKRVVIKEGEE